MWPSYEWQRGLPQQFGVMVGLPVQLWAALALWGSTLHNKTGNSGKRWNSLYPTMLPLVSE